MSAKSDTTGYTLPCLMYRQMECLPECEAGWTRRKECIYVTDQSNTTEATAAILTLDPNGGWDHDLGWGDHVMKSIRMSVALGFVEHGVSFDIDHWRLTDEGIAMRSKFDGRPILSSGDPKRDAGWLVSTPWLGRRMAVFGLTKEDAMAQAELGRRAHVAELQALVDRWTAYELKAAFVEADSNAA